MVKTTVYLPPELKERVELEAQSRGVSEADVIRDALDRSVSRRRPRPRGGIYEGREPIARRVDELLAGFGER
jgi:hypothetical protein